MRQDGLLFFHCCGQSGHVATSWQTWSFALEVAGSGVGFLHLWQNCGKVSCIRLDFFPFYPDRLCGIHFWRRLCWKRWLISQMGMTLSLSCLSGNARRTVAKKEECIARSPVPKVAGSSTLQQRRLDFKPWQKILAMAMKRVTLEMQRDVPRNIWYREPFDSCWVQHQQQIYGRWVALTSLDASLRTGGVEWFFGQGTFFCFF